MKKSTLLALVALMAPLGTLYAWDLPAEPKAPAITSADLAEVMEAQDTIYLLISGNFDNSTDIKPFIGISLPGISFRRIRFPSRRYDCSNSPAVRYFNKRDSLRVTTEN